MSFDPFGLSKLAGMLQSATIPHDPAQLEQTLTAMVAQHLAANPIQVNAAAPALKSSDFQGIVSKKLGDLMGSIDSHVATAVAAATSLAAVPSASDIEAKVEKLFTSMVNARVQAAMGVVPPKPAPPDTPTVPVSAVKSAPLEDMTQSDWRTKMAGHYSVLSNMVSLHNANIDAYNLVAKDYNTAHETSVSDDQMASLKKRVQASADELFKTDKPIKERVDLIVAMVNDAKSRGWWITGAQGVKDDYDTMKSGLVKGTKVLIPFGNSGYHEGVDTYY